MGLDIGIPARCCFGYNGVPERLRIFALIESEERLYDGKYSRDDDDKP